MIVFGSLDIFKVSWVTPLVSLYLQKYPSNPRNKLVCSTKRSFVCFFGSANHRPVKILTVQPVAVCMTKAAAGAHTTELSRVCTNPSASGMTHSPVKVQRIL